MVKKYVENLKKELEELSNEGINVSFHIPAEMVEENVIEHIRNLIKEDRQ